MLNHADKCTCPRCKEVEYPEVSDKQKIGALHRVATPLSLFYVRNKWFIEYRYIDQYEGRPYLLSKELEAWERMEDA